MMIGRGRLQHIIKEKPMSDEHKLKGVDWQMAICPECGLELHKHVIDIGCPVSDSGEDPIDWVGMLKADLGRLEKRIKEPGSKPVPQCSYCAGLLTTATEFRRTCPKCGRQV